MRWSGVVIFKVAFFHMGFCNLWSASKFGLQCCWIFGKVVGRFQKTVLDEFNITGFGWKCWEGRILLRLECCGRWQDRQ
ncbi:hypothetical protein M758_UG344600 [Ceratodon purpureus]|nr:hypothetical protein M758_UG344600 [Ceratodon purpureus]